MMKVAEILALLALAPGVLACSGKAKGDPDATFNVAFRAVTDEGVLLAGVSFATGKRPFGTTAESGTLTVQLKGNEGQTFPVAVGCPKGFEPPNTVPRLRLARTRAIGSTGVQAIAFEAVCTRRLRDAVIVVRAEKGVGLPISVDGHTRATVDASGTAHVVVQVDRDTRSLAVSLDTSSRRDLRPQNPSRVFELTGRDAIVLFEQNFAVTQRSPASRRAEPAPRHVPYRLD